ncbi:unnamed protein product [Vicia faba]|uniref:Uncharacterized protein n=1 Tax=Vicia faba TaxID=3906 RepID=A0AAV1BBV5_VICFA|nr:unnamed protein product [Vicia faba]
MDSDSSTIEHQDSLLSHFVSKLNEYLSQHQVYKFSDDEKLAQMFGLFSLFILARTKFGILHPKHHLSNKVDELYLRYQILLCFEIRVKIYGLNFLDEMENVQLRHYVDFCKIIISIIRMLLDLPITNTNDTFLVKLIPSLKLANNYSKMEDDSGKKMVRKLLEHITNRSDILLKKAESSHIDPEIIEFCCITLTLIKDSPFSTALCSIAKDMCYSLPNCSNNNSVYVKKILTTIKSDSKKPLIIDFKAHKLLHLPSPTNMVSSANWNKPYETSSFTMNPLYIPLFNHLATKANNNADKGSRCRNPRDTTKSFVGLPLIRNGIMLLNTLSSIHLIHLCQKPNLLSKYCRKSQLTQSNT